MEAVAIIVVVILGVAWLLDAMLGPDDDFPPPLDEYEDDENS